ncbi:hypothetical protein [Paenibacillus alginolyticus]|uniref:Uncharacterized protein n=1 Tax=Paenibacillus alginolyticus TaxID=59839 RepID=A0ABT4G7B6_9BACL|nr:hypothetical protein [Paenibacillus alginolyticus]MCY9692072.1 hypothetical protein [Paenibacillus alginolyticus]MEC0147839.1 hypothetical protein [Paenibacillus alginolyticus]
MKVRVKLALFLGIPILLLLLWFLKGYFFGYQINVWYKDSISKEEAESHIVTIDNTDHSCEKGTAFHTNNYMCLINIKSNPITVRNLLNQLKSDPLVLRADFLDDLINEFND